jgi:glycosyltransferase involved in cell wall biosynthesis
MGSLLARLRRRLRPGVRRAVAGAGAPRRALLLYSVAAFGPAARPERHQNVFQQRELAAAMGEQSHAVDVVDFDETRTGLLRQSYDLVVDLHPRHPPVYRDRLRPGALRIAYMTGSDPDYSNTAERRRLADLERRRGTRLLPRRQVAQWDRRLLESFDAMFYLGGETTLGTYAGLRLPPVHRLPNNGYDVEPTPPAPRDPARFLFLGSVGQVHKGLDLLIEAVARDPAVALEVCADFRREPDFIRAYRDELTGRSNIRVHGFMDVLGPAFRELQSRCGALVLPSASEGQAGSVTVGLGFGLPAAVSRRCGFDEEEFVFLPEGGPDAIGTALRALAARSSEETARQSAAALALFRRCYRPEHYARAVREALRETLARGPLPARGAAS